MAQTQIDSSVYDKINMPDFVGAMQRGMQMGNQMQDRALKMEGIEKEKGIQSAMKSAYSQNPDGSMSFDKNKALAGIAQIDGAKAFELEGQFAQQDMAKQKATMEKQMQQLQMTGQLLGGVQDQNTWMQALGQAQKMGIDTSQLPQAYDKGFVDNLNYRTMTSQERLANQYKQMDFGLREKELQSRSLDRKEARDERRFQSGIVRDEKMQGLKTPYGLANTTDDAKKLKEAHEAKANFDNKLEQMIALREKHGGGATLNREDVARGQQLSKDLLLEYKNMAKLGVLSQSDEAIINAIIPEDPLQYNSPLASIQGQDPTLARLKSFKNDSDKDFQTRVSTRTRAGIDSAATPRSQSQSQPQTVTQGGFTYTLNPETGNYE